jgi:hypothetical protein
LAVLREIRDYQQRELSKWNPSSRGFIPDFNGMPAGRLVKPEASNAHGDDAAEPNP